MEFTYLIANIAVLSIPLLFSFHRRFPFYKTWFAFWPAALLTATLFISWDMLFTALNIWSFNPAHLTGIYLFNLPVEEWLFFICIPYACTFTYFCFGRWIQKINFPYQQIVSFLLASSLLATGIYHYHRLHTSVTFIALAAFLIGCQWVFKVKWLGTFYITWAFLLIPFLLVNGILTGTFLQEPVFFYKADEILNVRLLTIPIEDLFYGMLMALMNVSLYEYFLTKKTAQLQIA